MKPYKDKAKKSRLLDQFKEFMSTTKYSNISSVFNSFWFFFCFFTLLFLFSGYETASYNKWVCKSWFFVNHTASTVSSWVLISVTVERLIVVYFPLKAKSISTKKVSQVVVSTILVLSCVAYAHYFWSYGFKTDSVGKELKYCTISYEYSLLDNYITNIRPWQDFVVRSAAPFSLLLFCNIAIIAKLQYELVRRRRLTGASSAVGGKDDSAHGVTVMLLTVSFVHLICMAPLQVM